MTLHTYDENFPGTIGRTYQDSSPWSPEPEKAPESAPNIVFVVLDDVGYSDLGCYGSEIETPHMDRLAKGGAQFTNFHVTSMCSPTRACLVTGRNAHSVGMGTITEWAGGYPSYRGHISTRAATIAEMLRDQAYSTMAVGKWHLTPMNEVTPAGPFNNWPLSRGFDRWYGFHGAFTDQWHPELFIDNHVIEPDHGDNYHLSEDLIAQSISFIKNQKASAPERPYFLYLGMGACHWPHHVPADIIAKYKGRYAKGWEVLREERAERQRRNGITPSNTTLPPMNPGIPRWDELSNEDRAFAERSQELFAGFLDHTDQQIGKLLSYLEASGQLDNTMVVLLSDNGASAEGGPLGVVAFNARKHLYHGPESPVERNVALEYLGSERTFPHYAQGWAQLSNTPLKWYKMNTYGGGVRAPMIMHWPKGMNDAGVRTQYHHVIDVLPTILDILGIDAPTVYRGVDQVPVQGISMRYAMQKPDAPTQKKTQHFELSGDRAIWHKGWKAVAKHEPGTDFDADNWELFHLDNDFSEAHNLAQSEPERLRQMVELWWSEAREYHVLPLDDRKSARATGAKPAAIRRKHVFIPGLDRIDRIVAPDMTGRSFSVTADVEVVELATASGVLLAFGTPLAGYTFFMQQGQVFFEYAYSEAERHVMRSATSLGLGRYLLTVEVKQMAGGRAQARLTVNGNHVASVDIPRTWPNRAVHGGLTCGRDGGFAVSDSYEAPFPFNATLHSVTVEITAVADAEVPCKDAASDTALIEE